MSNLFRILIAAFSLGMSALGCAYERSGPAAGGGFDPYVAPTVGTVLTSAEFRKLDCDQGITRVNHDSYYNCGGQAYKKDMLCGRRVYVAVAGMPY